MSDLILILIAYSPLLLVGTLLTVRKLKQKEMPQQTDSKNYLDSDIVTSKERFLSEEPSKEFSRLSERLMDLMEKEKLFLNPEIRIGDVAEKLYTNKTYLSKAIKETTNRNFCQLVHYYRIKEVMKLFARNPDQNIQDLAFKVGFNSPSTFNIAFGRIAGYTPAEWSRDFRMKNVVEEAKTT